MSRARRAIFNEHNILLTYQPRALTHGHLFVVSDKLSLITVFDSRKTFYWFFHQKIPNACNSLSKRAQSHISLFQLAYLFSSFHANFSQLPQFSSRIHRLQPMITAISNHPPPRSSVPPETPTTRMSSIMRRRWRRRRRYFLRTYVLCFLKVSRRLFCALFRKWRACESSLTNPPRPPLRRRRQDTLFELLADLEHFPDKVGLF